MSARPYTSGFCAEGLPTESHRRCAEREIECHCPCHTAPTPGLATPTGYLVTEAAPETPEWFAARREGITGTDLPKILGLSRYGNALSVWMDKRGELDDSASEAAIWGQVFEEPVAQVWAERYDTLVQPIGVVANVDAPWMRASLDRKVIHGACPDGEFDCGLEIKTRSVFKQRDWSDGVPDDVLAQTTWGLMVTGYDHMHVAALFGGQTLKSYRVDRDPKLEEYLLTAAREVWAAVDGGYPPEAHPDAEGVLLDLLDRMYAARAGDRELDADEAEKWLEQYAAGSDLEREAKRLKTQAKTALVQMLDDGDTGVIDGVPVFTYTAPAPGHAVPAAEVRRLRDEQPDLWQALADEGFIQLTNPGPRFDLKKKRAAKKETAA